MTFQTEVRQDQASGIVGELAFDGPTRAFRYTLDSGDAANNIFGRAFTVKAGQDLDVEAGGAGVFAGIMVGPKQHATQGPDTGTLDPTLQLRNGEDADFLTMGTVFVELTNAANVGDSVAYAADGQLTAFAPGAIIAAPLVQIPGAQVVRCDTAGAGLAVIQLTNQQAVNPTS